MSTCTSKEQIQNAKDHLRKVLAEENYATKNDKVMAAVESLSKLWNEVSSSSSSSSSADGAQGSTTAPTKSELFRGDWRILSSPVFPDRIINEEQPDIFQYTLGRISFNMFQPKKLVVTICHGPENGVLNMVHEKKTDGTGSEDAGPGTATYNFIMNIIVHTADGDLPAELFIEGYCFPESDTRMKVGFSAGTFRKHASVDKDEKLKKLWDETFDGAYAKAEKEQGYLEWVMRWMMKLIITLPTDEATRYEMKRVIHGHFDILYLDEEMRITRGHRGTVVIMTKEMK